VWLSYALCLERKVFRIVMLVFSRIFNHAGGSSAILPANQPVKGTPCLQLLLMLCMW
jgi:hypothetical protein